MYYLTQGIIFGLYAAVLPGPMQAFLLSCILRNGWKRTLPLAFVPLLSDGPIMLTLFLVLSQLPIWFPTGLRIVGGFFILYLAWDAYHTNIATEKIIPSGEFKNIDKAGFFKGITMNLLNPNVYIFWATIGVPTILAGWKTSPIFGAAYALGMYGAMIPAIMGWIALVGTIGLLKPNIQKIIARVIAFLLLIVGISMIVNGIIVIIPMINL